MTSTVPDLPVPDEARRVFADQHGLTPPGSAGRRVDWDAVDRDIRAIAAPMIAAELRKEASAVERTGQSHVVGDFALGWNAAVKFVLDEFRHRADELDPDA